MPIKRKNCPENIKAYKFLRNLTSGSGCLYLGCSGAVSGGTPFAPLTPDPPTIYFVITP